MSAIDVVMLSRIQFGMTALYHFLFVPLTIGLSLLIAIMESVYVMTGRAIWRDMTKFWGLLFGINFAMGVATGVTMEFQFGTNWAYYSQYVGDIFGAPLAIEGLMAFFLEATFVGLFFFGWDRLSKVGHLTVTWMVAIGSNLSALWILVANAWMQHPVGARFNFETMRMEMTSFKEVLFNPVAQDKFVHTVSAGYVTGSVFVLAVSAIYLLQGRHSEFAKRSMTIAAIEAMWNTEPAPASFTLFGLPDSKTRETEYRVQIPWVLGLIATRSLDQQLPGITDLVAQAQTRIRNGIPAYAAIEALHNNPKDEVAKAELASHVSDLGYALLLKRYDPNVVDATDAEIAQAAQDTVPAVATLFWSFRVMVGLGFGFIALFAAAFWLAARRRLDQRRWFLWVSALCLPLPWISCELGWIVAEYGRQPWAIEGILPTYLASSSVAAGDVWFSLIGFIVFYTTLAIVDLFLIVRTIRLGPDVVGDDSGPDRRHAMAQPVQ